MFEPGHTKSRLIELLDSSDKERGILIGQLEDCTEIDKEEMRNYTKQVPKFEQHMRNLKG